MCGKQSGVDKPPGELLSLEKEAWKSRTQTLTKLSVLFLVDRAPSSHLGNTYSNNCPGTTCQLSA